MPYTQYRYLDVLPRRVNNVGSVGGVHSDELPKLVGELVLSRFVDQVNDDGDLGGQVPRSTNLTALGWRRGCSVLARMEKWLWTHSWGLITRKQWQQ